MYDVESIKREVEADVDRLFAPWTLNRPENWKPDPATKTLVALGYWLDEELRRICESEDDRRTQLLKFNRFSRTYDVWETVVECLNDVVEHNVQQHRRGHRRWG